MIRLRLKTAARRRRSPAGLSLVEMLVAMAVSLIMVLGIAQLFELVGDGVAVGRASLQMSDELGQVSYRLQSDLERLTLSPDADSTLAVRDGFFSYVEGPVHDLTATRVAGESLLGDVDDVLCMTVRSSDEPFVGQILGRLFPAVLPITAIPGSFVPPAAGTPVSYYWVLPANNPDQYATITSDTAEVVWWTTLDDKNLNGVRDPGEFYRLHRRVFLVVPNLIFHPNYSPPGLSAVYFRNVMDVSVRLDTVATAGGPVVVWRSNSLQDLANRANRYGHSDVNAVPPPPAAFPYRLVPPGAPNPYFPNVHPSYAGYPASPFLPSDPVTVGAPTFTSLIAQFDATDLDTTSAAPPVITINTVEMDYNPAQSGSNPNYRIAGGQAIEHRMLKRGADVILSNVVAFDVRGFDPAAPVLALIQSSGDTTPLVPSDPGFNAVMTASPVPQIGSGGYVNLAWERNLTNPLPAALQSFFSGAPDNTSGIFPTVQYPAVYDSWFFQADQGADGIDNNGNGIVDDISEQGSPPPYNTPLEGVQVMVRIYDDTTRVIRQITVEQDL